MVRARHIRLPTAPPSRSAFRTTPPSSNPFSISNSRPLPHRPSPRLPSPERPRFTPRLAKDESDNAPPARRSVSPTREGNTPPGTRASLLSKANARTLLALKATASSPDLSSGSVARKRPKSIASAANEGRDEDDVRSQAGSAKRPQSERAFASAPSVSNRQPTGSPLYAALERGRLRLETRPRGGTSRRNDDDDDSI